MIVEEALGGGRSRFFHFPSITDESVRTPRNPLQLLLYSLAHAGTQIHRWLIDPEIPEISSEIPEIDKLADKLIDIGESFRESRNRH
jgi:hypothetical protein